MNRVVGLPANRRQLGRGTDRRIAERLEDIADSGVGDRIDLRRVGSEIDHLGAMAIDELAGDRGSGLTIAQVDVDEGDVSRLAVPQSGFAVGGDRSHIVTGVHQNPLDVQRDENFVLNDQNRLCHVIPL